MVFHLKWKDIYKLKEVIVENSLEHSVREQKENIMAKYKKTKYLNILIYEIKAGTRYRIRKKVRISGKEDIIDESGFKTIAHAKARLREIEESIDKSEIDYIRSHKLTVTEYYKEYANRKTMSHVWSIESRCNNDSLFRKHIEPIFGNMPLSKIKRDTYEIFINQKLEKLRRRSVQSIHIMFMALLNDAVYNGILERNRLQRVIIGSGTIPEKNKRISLKEYQQWMGIAEKILTKYEFSMIYLCVFGLRRGEVCGLRLSSIRYSDHPELATLHIADSRTQRTQKYGKGGLKTSSSNRYIVLDKKGTEAIECIIHEAKEIKKDYGQILHQEDFLLLNPTTCNPFVPSQLNRLFDKVSKSCNIKISPHMLRHFFATQAAIAGVPKEHAAAYLGHKNKTMTEYYTHIQNETATDVINIVSNRLNGSNSG